VKRVILKQASDTTQARMFLCCFVELNGVENFRVKKNRHRPLINKNKKRGAIL
jgi:hypothetical protein